MTDTAVSLDAFRRQRKTDAQEHLAQIRSQQILKLRAIEEHPGSSKKGKGLEFSRLVDRMIAARAVGRLVRKEKSSGMSITLLRERAGRIERYMLPPDADIASSAVRAKAEGRLMKKVRGYLHVAKAVAELTGRDADEAKISALEETSLWNAPVKAADADGQEPARHLALLLREMAGYVIRTSNVTPLFERIRRVPGIWVAEDCVFQRGVIYGFPGKRLSDVAYQDWNEHWSEAPPLPSVPLVRFLHSQLDVDLLIETGGKPFPRRDATRFDGEFEGEKRRALIRLHREIRLSIGPTTAPDKIGGMFESRPRIEVWLKDESSELQGPCAFDPQWDLWLIYGSAAQVRVDGAWCHARALTPEPKMALEDYGRIMAGESVLHPLNWDHTPLSTNRTCMEHSYFSWTPISGDYVQHWLDRPARRECMFVGSGSGTSLEAETWFDHSSIAQQVELSLIGGSLEQDLAASVDALRNALEAREREWREGASRTTEQLMQRWSTNQAIGASAEEKE